MKKILFCVILCFLSLSWLSAITQDDWARDSKITTLLQKVAKFENPFYPTTFDQLIQQTVNDITKINLELQQSPFDDKLKLTFHEKAKFLDSLLTNKVYYSCMIDTDMSDL